MAIDDNTSYELTGAQVKDLASKIKGNKALTENLAGGEGIAYQTIFMMPITPERSVEIAEELGDASLMPGTFMKYEFRMASTGEVIKSVGDLAGWIGNEGYNVVYKPVYSSKEQFVVTSIATDEDNYEWVEINISRIDFPNEDGYAAHIVNYNLNFSSDETYWYSTTRTLGKAPNVSCYVKYIGKYANEIAAEINASVPAGEEVGPSQLWGTMRFVFINPNTGAYAKTLTAIRALLRNSGTVIFLTDDTGYQDYSVTSASWTGSAASGHGTLSVFSPHWGKEYTYEITGPTEQSGSLSHIWYMLTLSETMRNLTWYSDWTIDPSTDTPDGAGDLGHDASNNIYIGVGSSSTSDWKQINNDAIVPFTGTDGTAAGAAGLVPAPAVGDTNKYLKSDGTWATVSSGTTWAGEKVFYGTCSTYYYTSAKAVSTSSDFAYEEGVVLFVKFTNYHTNSSFTLNVNSTGAKTVYTNGSSTSNGDYMWKANDIVGFVYDGSYWRMIDSDRATSSYWGKVKLASSYTSSSSDTVPTSSHLYSVYNIANNKQDKLYAGQGISISGNTISATNAGSTYTYSGAVDASNNSFTTAITDNNSVAQSVTLNAGSNITFSSSTALGKVGPTIVPNTTAAHYADITSLTFTPTNANLGYFFVLRVYKEYQMASGTNMYQATLYLSNTTYSYSSAAEVSAAINNEQIIVNPDFMAFSNYFTQINQSSFQSDAATAISQVSGVPANFGGTIDSFGQATYVDVYVYVLNESAFTISATGGSGGGAVTYYMTSGTTQGIPSYQTYIYSDAARTTVVNPDTILAAYESGNTILLKYESTQTGSSAYDMTLQVNSMSLTGEDGYKMLVSELNADNGNYNAVNTLIQATWDGTGTFSGRWVLVRNIYNKNALIIREWS